MLDDPTIGEAHLRIARPTDQMSEILKFYRDGLGFELLGSFEDHDGFDGVMLGRRGASYHLEFTHHHGHKAGKAPTEDNLLVFYLPDAAQWQAAVERMRAQENVIAELARAAYDAHVSAVK